MNIIDHIQKQFAEIFGNGCADLIVRSPGRINILGEHTDYNEGFVLPAAIDKAAYLAVSLRDDNEIHLRAHDLNESFSINIEELKPIHDISWPNYILGPTAQFIKEKISSKGFNAFLTSDVPIGAGVASSAAVECATVFALDQLLQTDFERISMAKIAQKSAHEYAGVKCGIMDQFTSLMGKKDHVIKLDCRSLEHEYVPFKLEGIKVLLLNTNVKHSLASSEYNIRRSECSQAIQWIKEFEPYVSSLRDVTTDMLEKYVFPKDQLIDMRCRFIVQENRRLLSGCRDLKNGDINELGRKMFATHEGLSKMYSVSCDELDWLVDFVQNNSAVLGARMMGGGFGGCTINLVKSDEIEKLVDQIKPAYEKEMGLPLTYCEALIENGTEIVYQKQHSYA